MVSQVLQTNLFSSSVGRFPLPLLFKNQIIFKALLIVKQIQQPVFPQLPKSSSQFGITMISLDSVIRSKLQSYNCKMIAARLQQTLNKRIEFVQNLLLIYSYSELVTIRLSEYIKQNQKMYEKELTLIETYKNLFRIDESFRKLFYSFCCKILVKLNSKYKMKVMKTMVVRIHAIHIEFVNFFKTLKQDQIVRFLSKIELESVSQSELFYILVITLIKYLKQKTDGVILKLREKCTKENSDFCQENTMQKLGNEPQTQNKNIESKRKRMPILDRKRVKITSIPLRKYHSQEPVQRPPHSERYSSNGKKSCFQLQKSCLETKQNPKIDSRTSFKKFQQVYASEWQKYYDLISPLKQELQQLNVRPKRVHNKQRREWIYQYFNSLYQQSLSRNQIRRKVVSPMSSSLSRNKCEVKQFQRFIITRFHKNQG